MSDIEFDDPVVFSSDEGIENELLYCYYGLDDRVRPEAFTVRLQLANFIRPDGQLVLEDIARFDHNGHSAFTWDPKNGDGFHIDVFPNGESRHVLLETPPPAIDYDVLEERNPPSERVFATMEYCRDVFLVSEHRVYLYDVLNGAVSEFDPQEIGLQPPSEISY